MMPFISTASTTVPVTQDPDPTEEGRFISVYDGVGVFTANIKFYEIIPPDTQEFQNIELVSYNSPVIGLSVSQFDLQTLQISGTIANVIQGGEFTFLMPDKSIQILPPDTPLVYDTLISWSPPSVKMITITHTLQVTIKKTPSTSNYTQTFTATQEVYWKYEYGLQSFQQALAKGRL